MKKILLTLLLVAVGFTAQAQNYFEITNIVNNGTKYIVLSSEDTKTGGELCYNDDNFSSVVSSRYEWDSSTNRLTLPGGASFVITDANTITDYNTSFAGRQGLIVTANDDFTSATGFVGSINESGVFN